MQLSNGQLNVLMNILPKMRFSRVVNLSTQTSVPLESLLHIRTAGKKFKVANDGGATEMVSNFIDEIIKPKAKDYAKRAKSIIKDKLKDNENIEEILNNIEDKYANIESNNKSSSDIEKYLEEKDLSKEEIKLLEQYNSLLRVMNGMYDSDLVNIIMGQANKLKSFAPSGMFTQEDAATEIMGILTLGNAYLKESELTEEQKEAVPEGIVKGALFDQLGGLLNQGKIPGAGAFLERTKTVASNLVKNLTQSKSMREKKEFEKSSQEKIEQSGGDEDFSIEYEEDPSEAFMKDNDEKGPITEDQETNTQQQQALKFEKSIRPLILQNLESIVKQHVPKNKPNYEDRVEKLIFIYKNALQNPQYTQTEKKEAEKESRMPIPAPASSRIYYNKNTELMKKHGINSASEYTNLTSGNIGPGIQEDIYDLIDKTKEEIMSKAAGATLSHQLLKRAASQNEMSLLGMVCAIEPKTKQFGKVMVFERGRPRAAHVFSWNLQKRNVRIANVNDVDEEHINDAYQAAFEAVKQQILENNKEEF